MVRVRAAGDYTWGMTAQVNKKFSADGLCLLVEDQEEARLFFQNTLKALFPELQIVAVENLRLAEEWLQGRSQNGGNQPLSLAIIDLGLPDGNGIELIRSLHATEPSTPSIVATIYDDDARLFGALAAGAYGYVLKDDGAARLQDILARLSTGEPPLSPAIAHRLLNHFRFEAPATPPVESVLTSREVEVLTLIARGHTVQEAAQHLKLSAQTVAGYVKSIYQKLHISNRASATREAIRLGLVRNS